VKNSKRRNSEELGLTLSVYVALTVFYASYLLNLFSTSPVNAGWVVFVSGTLSALSCVATGVLADRFANKAWILSVMGAGVACISFLVSFWMDSFWAFSCLMIVGAITCGSCESLLVFLFFVLVVYFFCSFECFDLSFDDVSGSRDRRCNDWHDGNHVRTEKCLRGFAQIFKRGNLLSFVLPLCFGLFGNDRVRFVSILLSSLCAAALGLVVLFIALTEKK
jgi:hypothetical protein